MAKKENRSRQIASIFMLKLDLFLGIWDNK